MMPATAPKPAPPGIRLSRAELTARIGQLCDENGALRLENRRLLLDLLREKIRADMIAALADAPSAVGQ
jgi:regulator of replication initiation timing